MKHTELNSPLSPMSHLKDFNSSKVLVELEDSYIIKQPVIPVKMTFRWMMMKMALCKCHAIDAINNMNE